MEVDDPAVYYAPAPQPTLPSPYHTALAAAAFSSRPPAAAATAIEGAKKKEKKPRYRADAFLKARRQDKALKSRNPRQLRKRYKAAERGELCGPLVPLCVCVCCACGSPLRACVAHRSARVARLSACVAHPRRGGAWGRRGALLIVCLIGFFSEEGVVNARCARRGGPARVGGQCVRAGAWRGVAC